MHRARRLLRGKTFGVMAALAILFPPSLCYAQLQKCFATSVSEQIQNQSYTSTMGLPPYTLNYQVKVDWDCTVGMISACTVCELDALYLWDPATSDYTTWAGGFQRQDMVPACVRPNTSTRSEAITGLSAGSYKLVVAYKTTNGNACSNPTGFLQKDVLFFGLP